MERTTRIEEIKSLFGDNFIGIDELRMITSRFPIDITSFLPPIPYSVNELEQYAEDYILILGSDRFHNNQTLNLLSLRKQFGVNPEISEPCFYNQDWYMAEEFMKKTLEVKWYLLKKEVFPDTRAELPDSILNKNIHLPSAILCAYTFFAFYFVRQEFLWSHDFIWCEDTDHNSDRIYIGRYNDIYGINKNGFNIHRHLSLRNCYGAINLI